MRRCCWDRCVRCARYWVFIRVNKVQLKTINGKIASTPNPLPLQELSPVVVTSGNIDVTLLSRFLAKVLPRCLHSKKFPEIFRLWERHGFHVTPVHFYQPIPDTRSLPDTLWDQPSKLVGIDMNDAMQLDLLRNQFPKFRHEYEIG